MLSAYIDESGTHADSKVACVAGLILDRNGASQLDLEWGATLGEAGLKQFHARDATTLRGAFKGLDTRSRDEVYRKLVGIVRTHVRGGCAAFVTSESQFNTYARSKGWQYSQYTTCAYACINVLSSLSDRLEGGSLKLVIEGGHKNMSELDLALRKLTAAGWKIEHAFGTKETRPLQAADLFAWEARKRVADQFTANATRLRKSLGALIQDMPQIVSFPLHSEALQVLFDEGRRYGL